jgi:DNA-binding protein HU-beta
MTKKDFINEMAQKAKVTKVDATKSYDAFLETVSDFLLKGERVTLLGFGTFNVQKRAARTARNPQSGAAIKVPAKKVVKFKAGADLSKKVAKKK